MSSTQEWLAAYFEKDVCVGGKPTRLGIALESWIVEEEEDNEGSASSKSDLEVVLIKYPINMPSHESLMEDSSVLKDLELSDTLKAKIIFQGTCMKSLVFLLIIHARCFCLFSSGSDFICS
jgi:hypothetical protein